MTNPVPRRFLSTQFGVRSLLVLMFLCAFGLAWRCWIPRGYVAESKVGLVRAGMSKEEVTRLLGPPFEMSHHAFWGDYWEYKIKRFIPSRREESLYLVIMGNNRDIFCVKVCEPPLKE